MPRTPTQNKQDPSRFNPYRKATAMEGLSQTPQELVPEIQTAQPDFIKGQTTFGTIQAGRGSNLIGGANVSSQIADIIGGTLALTAETVKAANAYYTVKDDGVKKAMEEELTELQERYDKGEIDNVAYNNEQRNLLSKYKPQFTTRKATDAIDLSLQQNLLESTWAEPTDLINNFKLKSGKIKTDVSYQTLENGEELREEALRNLQKEFIEGMEAKYGDNDQIMLQVYGAADVVRLTSAEAQQRKLSSAATKLLTAYADKYDAAIEDAVAAMARGDLMFASLGAFVQDILDRAGVPQEIRDAQGGAIEAVFMDQAKDLISRKFDDAQSSIQTKITQNLREQNDRLIARTANSIYDQSDSTVNLDAISDTVVDEVLNASNTATSKVILEDRLKSIVTTILPGLYFDGKTPKENYDRAVDYLSEIAAEAGYDLKDLDVYREFTVDTFDPLLQAELPATRSNAHRVFHMPSVTPRDEIIREEFASGIADIAVDQALLETQANIPQLVSMDKGSQGAIFAEARGIFNVAMDRPDFNVLDVLDERLSELDTMTADQKKILRELVTKSMLRPSYDVVNKLQLAKHRNNDWPGFYRSVENHLQTSGVNDTYVVTSPEVQDLSDMAKNGHDAVVRLIAFSDPGLAVNPEAYIQDTINNFESNTDVLSFYAQYVAYSDEKASKFWKDIFRARGMDLSDDSVRMLTLRYNPETLGAIVEASKEGKTFPLPSGAELTQNIVTDEMMSSHAYQSYAEGVTKTIAEGLIQDPKLKDRYKVYGSKEVLYWAYMHGLPPNVDAIASVMEQKGLIPVSVNGTVQFVTDNEENGNLRTSLRQSPVQSVEIDDAFKLTISPEVEKVFDKMIQLYSTEEASPRERAFADTLLMLKTMKNREGANITIKEVRQGTTRRYSENNVGTFGLFDYRNTLTNYGIMSEGIRIVLNNERLADIQINPEALNYSWNEYGRLVVTFPEGSGLEDEGELELPAEFGELIGLTTHGYIEGTSKPMWTIPAGTAILGQ